MSLTVELHIPMYMYVHQAQHAKEQYLKFKPKFKHFYSNYAMKQYMKIIETAALLSASKLKGSS